MLYNQWAKDSVGWMWLGANGKPYRSKWLYDENEEEWHYLKANGYEAVNEWAKDSHGWMWMDANGMITKNKWIKSGGYWYYLKADGYMATGKLTIDGKTYNFNSSGKWIP
jgi:glucan-binding YG repeat protein